MRADIPSTSRPPPLGARTLFVASALALVFCGMTLADHWSLRPLVATPLMVASIYWFGDVMDYWYRQKPSKRPELAPAFRLRFFGLLLCLAGLSMIALRLPPTSLLALTLILGIGVLDTVEIPFMRGLKPLGAGGVIRLNRVSIVKNLVIAVWWSLLLPLGAGSFDVHGMSVFMLFTVLQVMIGAGVGNLDAIERERMRGIRSLGGRIGVEGMLRWLRIANGFSALVLLFASLLDPERSATYLGLFMVVFWRTFLFVNIEQLGLRAQRLEVGNLVTCFLFPVACLLSRVFG